MKKRANKKTTQLQTQTDTIQIQLYRHLGGICLSMSLRAILMTMLRTYQLSGDLDLILTRLGRKAVFVEVIKVRVEECSLGWYSLAWVIHQHVHQQIVPGLNISTQFEGRNKKNHTLSPPSPSQQMKDWKCSTLGRLPEQVRLFWSR